MKPKFNPTVRDGKPEKCIVCGNQRHHEDYSKPNDVIWICEEQHTKYHDGKLGLFKNKLWWNPKRLLPGSMRSGMMPIKYQTLKSQFEKK